MRERAQHRCRVNFSLLRRCDSSILARSTPMQSQLFTFASVRQLNSRSLNPDAESSFHFCIGATAQFSLAQHRCRVNFSLLSRCDSSILARSTPMQSQLFTFASVPAIQSHSQLQPSPKISTINQPPPLLTKHFERGERVYGGFLSASMRATREGVRGFVSSRRSMRSNASERTCPGTSLRTLWCLWST